MKNNIEMYKAFSKRYGQWQYVAPYRYCFFDAEGRKLGRIIWRKENELNGVYMDNCDNEWGL